MFNVYFKGVTVANSTQIKGCLSPRKDTQPRTKLPSGGEKRKNKTELHLYAVTEKTSERNLMCILILQIGLEDSACAEATQIRIYRLHPC